MNSRKALYYRHFRRTKLPKLPNISSQPRYDHFDTAAYSIYLRQKQKPGCQPRYVLLQQRLCLRGFHRSPIALLLPLLFARFFRHRRRSQTSPVAVPEIFRSLSAHKISTAATPFCSLLPPPAALANVPTLIPLHTRLPIMPQLFPACKGFLRMGSIFFPDENNLSAAAFMKKCRKPLDTEKLPCYYA